MLKNKDFVGVEYLLGFSFIFFVGLLISINDLSSYPIDIPRVYRFKDARYILTPLQYFYAHLFVFLLFFLPAKCTIYKKCSTRLKAEGKTFKGELLFTLKTSGISCFKLYLYIIFCFGVMLCFVGATVWILFKVFAN